MKLTKEEKKEVRRLRKEKGLGVINEFKKFILRGNIIDMAVGVIVATAFTQIVTSLTNGIFMPLITFLVGEVKFDEIKTILRKQQLAEDGTVLVAEISLKWGSVIANIINFLLIALIIFTIVKVINTIRLRMSYYKDKLINLKNKEEEKVEEVKVEEEIVEEVKPTTNELLEKIIEILKDK